MFYKRLVIAGLIAGCTAGPLAVLGQTNGPATIVQVPAPAGPIAATPGSYLVNGQQPALNYIKEWDGLGRITDPAIFDAASYTDVKQTTQYLDGLGRPLQTVSRQASPGTDPKDLVSPVIYDAVGRETYKYLPYVQTTDNTHDGLFKVDPFTAQKEFYQNIYPGEQPAYAGELVYYGQVQYESSPLNRVLKTLAPGNSWAGNNVGVSMQYLHNNDADNVVMWNIDSDPLTYVDNDLSTNIPVFGGYYPAGQLYKNVTTDEQEHSVVEYKDKDGRIILKKVQVGRVPSDFSGYSGWLSTYYIYDDLNQLRFVLSPKAVTVANGNGWNLNADPTTMMELCYRYEYDTRGRMIAKKVPGAGWVYMIYDVRDRLVYTQDANMRGHSQWMTTLFDALDRPIATGMISYSGLANQLQDFVTTDTSGNSSNSITIAGSSAGSFPASLDLSDPAEDGVHQALESIILENGFSTSAGGDFTAEIVSGGVPEKSFNTIVSVTDNVLPPGNNFIGLTMTFYDDYTNTSDKQYTTAYNGLLDAGNNQHAETLPSYADNQVVQTIGLVTGRKVRVIENPNDLTQGGWLESASFYDDRGRVVQTQVDNYKGGQDIFTTLYNFTNQPITTYLAHNNPAATINDNTHVKTNMSLDASNRLLQVYKTINDLSDTRRLIAQQSYDQMGQLKQKQLGQLPDGSFLETQDYTYNIRGWLKGINGDYANNDNTRGANDRWFGMDLSYDWGFATNQLNGNISGNIWRSKGDGQQRAYGFGYDDANRLLFADYNQYGSNWDKNAGVDFSTTMGNGTDPSTAYDENGNILGMKQMAWQVGGSKPIDDLQYNYLTNSNRLKNVIDGANDPTTTLGDFRTSALSPYHTGKDKTAVDYYYDVNGNLTRDLNKDIGTQATDGIVYNHLNLPWQVTMHSATGGKGTITYIYDAMGNKLKKTTMDNAANLETVTTYIGPFQYQGTSSISSGATPTDNLQFFGHEEGRVRVKTDNSSGQNVTSYVYDYFLKDHLGNTRTVLTDEQETDEYPMATMEQSNAAQEDIYYTMLDDTREPLPPGYPSDPTTNPNAYVARLHVGSDNQPVIGPGIVLKVMAGDKFSVRFTSWYQLNGANPLPNNTSPVSDIVTAMIAGLGHIQGENPVASALQNNNFSLGANIGQFITAQGTGADNTKPQAFLNWVLLDNQFNYVESSSGFKQVGGDGELSTPLLGNLPIYSSGYLYIYTSNATPNVDAFFDNLQVTHTRGPLLEEDHYYPFGLTMAGISDKALKAGYAENKYRFNKGSELQNKEFADGSGLEMYETHLRELDPQLGRWWQVDSKPTEAESPYSAMGNNPVLHNDPLGDSVPQWISNLHFRPAEPGQYDLHPVTAALADVSYGLADFFGLTSGENAIRTVADPKASTTDKVLAVVGAGLAMTNGEEGAGEQGKGASKGAANSKVAEAISAGKDAHAAFSEKAAAKGWDVTPRLTDPLTGKTVIPDAVTPSGHPVELKPKTPTGIAKGENQLPKYERATGNNGRVVYYDPLEFLPKVE